MKKYFYKIIVIMLGVFILISPSIVKASEEKSMDDYLQEYKEKVYSMVKTMKCIPKTGDVNLDYLYQIALLSEEEIEVCNIYVKYSSNEEVKKLAKSYIEKESSNVDNIKALIESLKDRCTRNDEKEEEYLKFYDKELNKKICKFQKMEWSDNLESNFLKVVMSHHDVVIKISDKYLSIGDNLEVKRIAEKVNSEMKRDIEDINKYIK